MNIKDFSRQIGVSTATVSRAFSGNGRISDKTRAMILQKAAELGYCANVYAKNLTSRRSNTIGFFYPTVSSHEADYFISEIMLGVNQTALSRRKVLQIHPMNDSQENLVGYQEHINNGSLEGVIIVAGSVLSKELVRTAKLANIPYVVIGYMSDEAKHAVTFSIEHGVRLVGNYFVKTGRKKPAYVGGVNDRRKREGFVAALGDLMDDVVFHPGGGTLESGSVAFQRIIQEHPDVDCVFCANDIIAIGFIRAALNHGLKIPEDIAVIGCDDIRISKYYYPALTTIAFHQYEIGERAVEKLCKQIDHEEFFESNIQCELVIRESA